MVKIKKIGLFVLLLIIFSVTFIKGVNNLDPDFGWHLRMGDIILSSGIPKTDPFSYSMPSFPFVDHEWLTNVVMFKLYQVVGQLGLSLIFSFLAVLSLVISIGILGGEKGKFKYFAGVMLFLGSAIFLPFEGIRPQVLSWLFLAILLKVFFNDFLWKKWSIFLPLFFLLWTNAHGSFGLGVLCLLFLFVARAYREKKVKLKDTLVVILCVLITFINPYQQRLWGEFWMQVSDGSLRFKIMEWYPGLMNFDLSFIVLISISVFLIWRYRKKYLLEEIALFSVLLFGSLSTVRNTPLWVIFALPMTIKGTMFLYEEAKGFKDGEERLMKVGKIALLGLLGISIVCYIFNFSSVFSLNEDKYYPKGAVAYLKANPYPGSLFSTYNWGGYLIWQYPEKKVFIDGRMPSWRWNKVLPGESTYAMTDYEKILRGETPFEEAVKKYYISTVLLPAEVETKRPLINIKRFFKKKESFDLLKKLQEQGWQIVYQDKLSVVLKRQ